MESIHGNHVFFSPFVYSEFHGCRWCGVRGSKVRKLFSGEFRYLLEPYVLRGTRVKSNVDPFLDVHGCHKVLSTTEVSAQAGLGNRLNYSLHLLIVKQPVTSSFFSPSTPRFVALLMVAHLLSAYC